MVDNFFFVVLVSGLHDVAFFAVQRQVQSFDLLFRSNPQAEQYIADLQNSESPDDGERPCNASPYELIYDLAGVTIHQAERERISRAVLQSIVDPIRGKHTGEDRAQRSACTVNTKSI